MLVFNFKLLGQGLVYFKRIKSKFSVFKANFWSHDYKTVNAQLEFVLLLKEAEIRL